MSINNLFDTTPFSISGVQNLSVDTINGSSILSTINISGQTAYLSYDNTTSTLTLLIPNANASTTGLLTSTDWNTFNNKISTINVAGQTAYISYNSLTETITLSIPNATNSTIGLLTSTDWNTFNNKENTLSFSSPLNRVGNNINFDFTQSLTFNGNTQTLNNNTIVSGGLFYTGAITTTTPLILYIDNSTGYITKGAVPSYTNLLPLNNDWTGSNRFYNTTYFGNATHYIDLYGEASLSKLMNCNVNSCIVEGCLITNATSITTNGNAQINSYLEVRNLSNNSETVVFRRGPNAPNEFVYYNNSGNFGLWNGSATEWELRSDGTCNFKSTSINGILTVNNSYANFNNSNLVMSNNVIYFRGVGDANHFIRFNTYAGLDGLQLGGWQGGQIGSMETGIYRILQQNTTSNPFRAYANYSSDPNTYINYNEYEFGGVVSGVYKWYIQNYGRAIFDSLYTTGTAGIRSEIKHTAFFKNLGVNNWITDTHGDDGKSKVVIGNLGDVIGGDVPCVGGHNSPLGAWTDMWINPYTTTYFGNVVVNGAFSNPSDRRIKTDISYLDSGKSINFIKALKPCIFRRCDKIDDPYLKEDEEQPVRRLEHGFIAQDIEEVATTKAQKLIVNTEQYKGEERKTITLLSLIPEIVQANKEMINKIELLEQENQLFKEQIKRIMLKIGII